jgi:hypothetical protein
MQRLAPILLLATLAACGNGMQDYPQLLPVDQLLTDEPLTPDPAPGLEARAADLRARAAWLRSQPTDTTN